MSGDGAPLAHHPIAIIGAGFAGLGAAIRLVQEGRRDFILFEKSPSIGGVWRDNTYPGCACDVESLVYSFSFVQSPEWSRSFSSQPEILAYLERCVEQFGLRPHLKLGTPVLDSEWDDEHQLWRLKTSAGEVTAGVIIAGVGALSEPVTPAIPGSELFRGAAFHSARWDHAVELEGKRVAVVGTGASAIQIVPAIQRKVAKLHLFQRTPPWILPRRDRPWGPVRRWVYRTFPSVQRLARRILAAFRELFVLVFLFPERTRWLEAICKSWIRRQIPDGELALRVTPSYRFGCKRILLSDDYYPALTQPNVEVVAGGACAITEKGVVDQEGREREVDAIVFATGFDVVDPSVALHIRGRGGRRLIDDWTPTMKAHLGTTVAGYPNLFLILGPNTGLGHSSVVEIIEAQIEHVLSALRYLAATGQACVEPRPEVQEAFVQEVDRRLQHTVWATGGCSSWYIDKGGRISTLWPRSIRAFRRRVRRFEPADYVTAPARTMEHQSATSSRAS